MVYLVPLGQQIRRYREALGWTLERLSELSSVDVGTISALEVRGSMRSKYAPELARAFGLTVEQLLDEETDYLDLIRSPRRHLVVAEPAPTWDVMTLPFRTLGRAQLMSLTPTEVSEVEAFIRGLLASRALKVAGSK